VRTETPSMPAASRVVQYGARCRGVDPRFAIACDPLSGAGPAQSTMRSVGGCRVFAKGTLRPSSEYDHFLANWLISCVLCRIVFVFFALCQAALPAVARAPARRGPARALV